MTEERIIEIFEDDEISTDWEGDNAFQGLLILSKYVDVKQAELIVAAEHDIIYGPTIDKVPDITEEDVLALKKLNWMLENGDQFACFV